MTLRRAAAHAASGRRPPGRYPLPAVPVAAALLLTLLLALLPGSTAPGGRAEAAVEGSSTAQITLARVTPPVLQDGRPVTITGTVRNTANSPIASPVVHVRVQRSPLDTRARVDGWSTDSSTTDGAEVATTTLPDPLAPLQSATFSITIPASKVAFGYNLATLPTIVLVTDGTAQTAASTRGSIHTFLEYARDGTTANPLQVGWVVPLTLPADPALFGPPGAARTAAWQHAIGPGSPIDATLTALSDQPVTWLVDPAMLEPSPGASATVPPPATESPQPSPTTSSTTSPPSASSGEPSGTPSAGPSADTATATAGSTADPSAGSTTTSSAPRQDEQPAAGTTVDELAADLRSRLAAAKDTQPVWFLPYGDPDLSALSAAGGAAAVHDHLQRALSPGLRQIGSTMPLWAAGDLSDQQLTGLSSTWHTTRRETPPALISTRSLDGATLAQTTTVGRRLHDGTPVLAYDEQLSFTAAAAGGDPTARTRLFLARSMTIYQQAPSTRRSVLVLAPRTGTASPAQLAQVIGAAQQAPWLSQVATDSLLAQARSARPNSRLDNDPSGAAPSLSSSPISGASLDRERDSRALVHDLSTVLVDSEDVTAGWSRALDELGSTRWRGASTAYGTVLARDYQALVDITRSIKVIPSTINFFTDKGVLSVTVSNELNRPVHNVQLLLSPRAYLLTVKSQPQPLSLRARSRSTVRVPVVASAVGRVRVDAILSTPSGDPLGAPADDPATLVVNARPTASWIFWALGIVAGLIFVIGLYRSLRRGPRAETTMQRPPGVPEASAADRHDPLEGDDD